jgi:flagellar motor switch protein FliN
LSQETSVAEPDSQDALEVALPATTDSDPFAGLPRLTSRQVRLERGLTGWSRDGRLPEPLSWLEESTGATIALEKPEVLWRASGLRRAGLVAQLTAPRLATRLAVGIEIPLAHTVVDRLLGFDRPFAESRLQLTPVEWGVWSFLFLRALDSLGSGMTPDRQQALRDAGLAPAGDLTLDRVGPDPFDPAGLGSIVTIRWPIRLGGTAGALRLWLPESLVERWITFARGPAAAGERDPGRSHRGDLDARSASIVARGQLSSTWRAVGGIVEMPQGLRRLRTGGILPFAETRLLAPPHSPNGPLDLVLDRDDCEIRCRIPARPVADSGGRLVCIESGLVHEPRPRDPTVMTKIERIPMSQPTNTPIAAESGTPLDVPVTLTVELGRVNLSISQLADLKPGDVVELGRHSRSPVELTSSGRLVARGDLVLIDTDLGVRVTSVFL